MNKSKGGTYQKYGLSQILKSKLRNWRTISGIQIVIKKSNKVGFIKRDKLPYWNNLKVNENLNELEFKFSYNQGTGVTAIANTFLWLDEKQYFIRPETLKFATTYKEMSLRFK